ncbi:hypothetical protein QTO34_008731 [Cnephaeus nilssonii]|uniref:Uncharacterized protein n=1 Tax=Cnephaeus nilssonii TaxID=3371016 RepID=A0AA40LGL6_CNENI|nr:hypothetical protein QTO34_008731 [Eptesicus nilssonii]
MCLSPKTFAGCHPDRLQIALESTTASLASLQRQVTSVAQIALQNRRALDLLAAKRGGTCMFLQDINESGVVEQNVQTLTKLSEELPPCLLKFIRSRIAEMSPVTVNQLLLHPYTRLPLTLNQPLPDPGL